MIDVAILVVMCDCLAVHSLRVCCVSCVVVCCVSLHMTPQECYMKGAVRCAVRYDAYYAT